MKDFKNILDLSGIPKINLNDENDNNLLNPFSDLGAWHGYYLPNEQDFDLYGGFTGPLIIGEEYPINLTDNISQIIIRNKQTKETYNLKEAETNFNSYPGKLFQEYKMSDFILTLELIFCSNRTALIKTNIKNIKEDKLLLDIKWIGKIFNKACFKIYDKEKNIETSQLNQRLESRENEVIVNFSDIREKWSFFSNKEAKFLIKYSSNIDIKIKENNYEAIFSDEINLKENEIFESYSTETYTFTKNEMKKEEEKLDDFILNGEKYFEENKNRWNGYIEKTFDECEDELPLSYKKAVVKSIETLMTNWRSNAGELLHDGITPSVTYKWFNGLWAWDSWKQAVATVHFNEELAKNNIRALFDYQITGDDEVRPQDKGAIIDAIFYNKDESRREEGGNWNERNSKPPLATWAVWNIYKKTNDIEFLIEMYPKLIEYHNWWYTNRDHNKNGIVEYGAMIHEEHFVYDKLGNVIKDEEGNPKLNEDAIIKAAAWESGMDNAVRFDKSGVGKDDVGIKVFINRDEKNNIIGYSINQESVDLNSYLYAEKLFLSLISKELGHISESKRYINEAEKIKEYIRENMFDKKTGFFYDLQISEDGKSKKLLVNRGKGTDGFIPLWVNVASKKQAELVRNNMVNENMFNTYMPFPTASNDNTKFQEEKYWRGPVWLDQALFGIEALKNYGYNEDSINMTKKLFENAKGLLENEPIRENYNPETGEGLNATNFSWSASAYYLLYKNLLDENWTTIYDLKNIKMNKKSKTLTKGIVISGLAILGLTVLGYKTLGKRNNK